jgi:hypothetical protein
MKWYQFPSVWSKVTSIANKRAVYFEGQNTNAPCRLLSFSALLNNTTTPQRAVESTVRTTALDILNVAPTRGRYGRVRLR